MNILEEEQKLETILNKHEKARMALIEVAKATALRIAATNGRVTSPEVVASLREQGYGEELDQVDKRFMGAVFRRKKGWERLGFENLGSHAQAISVWTIKE